MKDIPQNPPVVCLYDGAGVENFDIQKVGEYLGQWFGTERVQIRDEFIRHHLRSQERIDERRLETLAESFSKARIKEPTKRLEKDKLVPEQLDQEHKWLLQGTASVDVFYDGVALQQAYLNLIHSGENSLEFLHLAFTNRLIGTWDQSDRRYHARVSIYGWPSIISTTGVVQGPARPREYYFGVMAGLD